MNNLVSLEGPNPIANLGAHYVSRQTGYSGDSFINQTTVARHPYGFAYDLEELHTKLTLAHDEVAAKLDRGPTRDSGIDYGIIDTPTDARIIFKSAWSGVLRRSVACTVPRNGRNRPEAWIDETVEIFEYELNKTGIRRKKIAGSIGYLI